MVSCDISDSMRGEFRYILGISAHGLADVCGVVAQREYAPCCYGIWGSKGRKILLGGF